MFLQFVSNKVINNLDITCACSTFIFLSIGMISFKQTVSMTEVFHFKTPVLDFHFCYPQVLKLFSAGFSSQISIIPPIE